MKEEAYIILVLVNIVAAISWFYLLITIFTAHYKIKKLTLNKRIKRRFVQVVIKPLLFLTVFYFLLLSFWVSVGYDEILNPHITFAWSIFHILTPIFFSVFIKEIEYLIIKNQ